MTRVVVLPLVFAACGFSLAPGAAGDIDAAVSDTAGDVPGIDTIDGPAAFDLAHIGPADEATLIATADVTWTVPVSIDTSAPSTTISLPPGAELRVVQQENGGPAVAVLSVHRLTITAPLTITGGRPLIIYSASELRITAPVDVAGHANVGGPGARTGGAGFGLAGTHMGTFADGGGGGGSFGAQGAVGGNATEGAVTGMGGPRGVAYGDASLTILEGGSGGGSGLPAACTTGVGGGGGGAIQLSAVTSIELTAAINAGGGGGGGGITCAGNMGSAGGGGSGGAIYLQAPMLIGTGTLAANGGAGGSGSNWGGSVGNSRLGQVGQDGLASANAATGGAAQPSDGGRGGDGAATAGPQAGSSITSTYPNGGGGGGGVGRIVIAVPGVAPLSVQSSPPYTRL